MLPCAQQPSPLVQLCIIMQVMCIAGCRAYIKPMRQIMYSQFSPQFRQLKETSAPSAELEPLIEFISGRISVGHSAYNVMDE